MLYSDKLKKRGVLSTVNKRLNLSILMVTYNEERDLIMCLGSLYKYNRNLNFETIVINNGAVLSTNLKSQFPKVTWIENNRNIGFTKAVNQGIKIAQAKYILALNSDTVLLEDSLYPLVKFIDEHKKAGAAGGKILNSQGIIQPSCRRFPTYLNALFNRTSLLTRLFPNNRFSKRYLLSHWNHQNIRRVDWVCGAFIIFRREAILDVGYLDEDYFIYCEEVDWCYQAKQKGWKVYYVPEAELIHNQKNNAYTKRKIILHHKSMLRFYRKHLKTPFAIQVFIATGIFLKVIGLFLLYDLGMAFKPIHKTRKVSQKLSNINAWQR